MPRCAAMASLTNRRLRLGLVVSGPRLGVPPILSLMAKARWSSLWLPDGQPPPVGSAEAVEVGWVVEQRGAVPAHTGAVWLRGPAADGVAETVASMQEGGRVGGLSVDVVDVASADAARRL